MTTAAAHDGRPAGPADTRWDRWRPLLVLFLMAPVVGEYLLGNVPLRHAAGLLVLAPLYGGGALLVREAVRHRGGGGAALLAGGAAYGVVEAGLFDGSLFNPAFQGMDLATTPVPWLGISADNALHFVAGHAVWSITVPIVLAEAFAGERARRPWLRPAALVPVGCAYLAGLLIQLDMRGTGDFRTTLAQAAGTLVVALVLAALALLPLDGARPRPAAAPRPLWLVPSAFVLSSLFLAAAESWLGVACSLLLLLVSAELLARVAGRVGWGRRHELAVVAGLLATYAWAAQVVTALRPDSRPGDAAGAVLVAVAVGAVLALAVRRTGRSPSAAAR